MRGGAFRGGRWGGALVDGVGEGAGRLGAEMPRTVSEGGCLGTFIFIFNIYEHMGTCLNYYSHYS